MAGGAWYSPCYFKILLNIGHFNSIIGFLFLITGTLESYKAHFKHWIVRYSRKFENDYTWYLSVSKVLNFDGTKEYFNKKGVQLIQFDKNGLTAKECFYLYDSKGVIKPTCEPLKLKLLFKTKGSVNLHIKMYAEDRAKGYLPKVDFMQICAEIDAPKWFIKAVENQKIKYYDA